MTSNAENKTPELEMDEEYPGRQVAENFWYPSVYSYARLLASIEAARKAMSSNTERLTSIVA